VESRVNYDSAFVHLSLWCYQISRVILDLGHLSSVQSLVGNLFLVSNQAAFFSLPVQAQESWEGGKVGEDPGTGAVNLSSHI
jgi:hypothetical protein